MFSASVRKSARPLVTISVAAFLLAVAVLAFGMRSFGWFSNNKTVSGTGMQVVVSDEGTGVKVTEYTVYKFDQLTNTYVKGDNEDDFAMPRYDSVFTERNVNTSAIVRVELDLTRDIAKNESIFFDIMCEEGLWKTVTKTLAGGETEDVQVIGSYLSNLINMKVLAIAPGDGDGQVPLADSTSEEIEAIYSKVTQKMATVTDSAKFVTPKATTSGGEGAESGETEPSYKNFEKPETNIVLYELHYDDFNAAIQRPEGGGRKLYIYIQINYDYDLVQSYLDSQEDAGVAMQFGEETADGNQFYISADLMTITLSAGPARTPSSDT